MQESGARVPLHQQVNVFLGLVEAGQTRFVQRPPDLFSDMVVYVDLEVETGKKVNTRDVKKGVESSPRNLRAL